MNRELFNARLGAQMRAFRTRAGLTTRSTALRVGVSQATVTSWERGTRTVTVENLSLHCQAVGADPGQVMALTLGRDPAWRPPGMSEAEFAARSGPIPCGGIAFTDKESDDEKEGEA
jgi:transcriptional regulator with XRE-family HTH domain